MNVLIILPAYNEEANIENVITRIRSKCPNVDYVIVNDGSKDNTSKICHENNYNVVDLPVNLGLAGAFQTGLRYAYENGYKYAIQIDADGQHNPKYIDMMREKIDEGYDIVIGSRFVDKKKPKSMRMLGSRMIAAAIRITTGSKLTDPTSGMRMYGERLIKELAYNINFGPEPDTVSYLLKQGVKVTEVQTDMKDRENGESYLNFANSIKYMFRMLVSILIIQNFRENKKKLFG